VISALDTSVILDVLSGDGAFSDASMQAIRRVWREGSLIVCEWVVAELLPTLRGREELLSLMLDWQIHFVPQSRESAVLAGEHFSRYVERGGAQKRVLPDFLIGAHARIHADRLVARDRGYLKDYFDDLVVLDPSAGTDLH
jgi:predicted nucleic acid-binding protein